MPPHNSHASIRSTDASPRSSLSSPSLDLHSDADAYELHEISPIEDGAPDKQETLDVPAAEHEGLLPSPRRFSIDSVQSFELYTPDEDKAVLRKLDRRLVAFMALLYCLSFLDRSSECVSAFWKRGGIDGEGMRVRTFRGDYTGLWVNVLTYW